ncbi:MAG: undecaprenyldiphospho-muramoylpentapeptide beta-N-acetylglucosaminyltransferase [Chloroflexota bacterium]
MANQATETRMRIAVTGGGTGGHVYPAMAVIAALSELSPLLLYFGTGRGIEADLVQRQSIPFAAVSAGALRGRSPLRLCLSLGLMLWGFSQSLFALRRFQPDVVLATGGYVCVPVVVAAWVLRISSLIYLPDVEPGWAVRFLSRFASKIAVTAEKSRDFLPARKVVVTGYPVRPGFTEIDKTVAKNRMGLDDSSKTLLVWGGSRGAHSINVAMSRMLPELLGLCRIIHLSGTDDEPWLQKMRSSLPEENRRRYLLYGYLHEEFPVVLAAVDLAVSRAGASTMGEFTAAGLPSVLIPYPFAGGHQRQNAGFLAERGAARIVEESEIEELLPLVKDLLASDDVLAEMAENARRLAQPEAARKIATLLEQLGRDETRRSTDGLQGAPWRTQ